MLISDWCEKHRDVVVSISNPRSKDGYRLVITMESALSEIAIVRELSGKEPATNDEIVNALHEMYEELKINRGN